MTESGKKGGRPTLYRPDYPAIAKRLALLGLTDAKMAEVFGVSERSFNDWKRAHPAFKLALTEGKADADARVAESLYRAAVGGGIIKRVQVETSAEGLEKRTITEQEAQGDVQAMRWWLKNRQPELWRERVEVSGEVRVEGVDTKMLDELYVQKMAQAHQRQQEIDRERADM